MGLGTFGVGFEVATPISGSQTRSRGLKAFIWPRSWSQNRTQPRFGVATPKPTPKPTPIGVATPKPTPIRGCNPEGNPEANPEGNLEASPDRDCKPERNPIRQPRSQPRFGVATPNATPIRGCKPKANPESPQSHYQMNAAQEWNSSDWFKNNNKPIKPIKVTPLSQ